MGFYHILRDPTPVSSLLEVYLVKFAFSIMSHVRDNIRHIPFIVLHPINPHHQFQPKVTSYFTSYKQHIIFYYNIPINIFVISMAGYFSLFKSCTTHLMSITTAYQMRLYLCIIAFHRIVPDRLARVLLHFAYSASTSPHRIDRDHVFIASTTTTSSSHRPRPRLHRIDRVYVFIASTATATTSSSHRPRLRLHRIDHVFIASTASTSSSHRPRPRPRLHRIDRDHVFIASTASTSSSHRPRPRLHRIDHDHVLIASTTTTSSSHRPRLHLHFMARHHFDNRHIVCDCHLCTAPFSCHFSHMAPACRPMLLLELSVSQYRQGRVSAAG